MLLNFETELDKAKRIIPEADRGQTRVTPLPEVPPAPLPDLKGKLVIPSTNEVDEEPEPEPEPDFKRVVSTEMYTLFRGDSLDVLRSLPDDSVHAVVTDPPYGLSKEPDMAEVLTHWLAGDDYKHRGGGFMGKSWDSFVPGPSVWKEVYRVLKPGGHLLCFAGSRTLGLMDTAIRLAGFEIRDGIMWLYGQGMPKSHDISKAIDKAAGKERTEVLGPKPGHEDFVDRTDAHSAGGRSDGWERPWRTDPEAVKKSHMKLAPATDDAAQWDGWGTGLKPAYEPVIMARKPFKGTVANNVLEHGTGGINIDATRIGTTKDVPASPSRTAGVSLSGSADGSLRNETGGEGGHNPNLGRWPSNVIMTHHPECVEAGVRKVKTGTAVQRHGGGQAIFGGIAGGENTVGEREDATYADEDGTETIPSWECHLDCPVGLLDGEASRGGYGRAAYGNQESAERNAGKPTRESRVDKVTTMPDNLTGLSYSDRGGVSRFFYTSKASTKERERWLKGRIPCPTCGNLDTAKHVVKTKKGKVVEKPCRRNTHPTVKPVAIMEYLSRLVTPPGGIVLDPFMGSGTTGVACMSLGAEFIGIDLEGDSVKIAKARIEGAVDASQL